MEVTDRDIKNIRRISEDVFGDAEYVEIDEVKDTKGDVMVSVDAVNVETLGIRNAFAGSRLRKYHEGGYVAVAVGGGDEHHSAWFERADSIEFGDPEPVEGEYPLKDDWSAVVGDNLVVRKDGDVVAHIDRDGWRLDRYPLYYVLPLHVGNALEEHGFDPTDDLRHD